LDEVSGKKVLEVGSYNVNGSLRDSVLKLSPSQYIGIDLISGPGVDIVCNSDDIIKRFGRNQFGVVISTCSLEHTQDWRTAISNMKNSCEIGGILIIIVPSIYRYHGYPYDYWRYSVQNVKDIFSDCEIVSIKEDSEEYIEKLVYAKIKKPIDFVEIDLTKYHVLEVVKPEIL
jgi:SAM-dependent methyltransferase